MTHILIPREVVQQVLESLRFFAVCYGHCGDSRKCTMELDALLAAPCEPQPASEPVGVEMPEPVAIGNDLGGWPVMGYTADQMREYAAAMRDQMTTESVTKTIETLTSEEVTIEVVTQPCAVTASSPANQLAAERDALREAAKAGLNYAEEALIDHDQAYKQHPAVAWDRSQIKADIDAIRAALEATK